jgi:hypothetical protein
MKVSRIVDDAIERVFQLVIDELDLEAKDRAKLYRKLGMDLIHLSATMDAELRFKV